MSLSLFFPSKRDSTKPEKATLLLLRRRRRRQRVEKRPLELRSLTTSLKSCNPRYPTPPIPSGGCLVNFPFTFCIFVSAFSVYSRNPLTLSHTLSLSLSLSLSHSLSLSDTHTHSHSHTLSLPLSHTRTHTLYMTGITHALLAHLEWGVVAEDSEVFPTSKADRLLRGKGLESPSSLLLMPPSLKSALGLNAAIFTLQSNQTRV